MVTTKAIPLPTKLVRSFAHYLTLVLLRAAAAASCSFARKFATLSTHKSYLCLIKNKTGHWLGLRHTFHNQCNTPGDFIDDTNYEDKPSWEGGTNNFACSTTKDTCPGQPGNDPIRNFMVGYCTTKYLNLPLQSL